MTITHSIGASALGDAVFGQGTGPIVRVFLCRGSEETLASCSFIVRHNCQHTEDAGVRCMQGMLYIIYIIILDPDDDDDDDRAYVCNITPWLTPHFN